MFDLNQAIAEWRKQMAASGINLSEALDELESHLRDDVDQLMGSGVNETHAFQIAVERIGQAVALKQEFAKASEIKWAFLQKLKLAFLGSKEIPFPSLENFAPAARQTLEVAPDEARRFHHDFIGTEHVLLGLTQFKSGIVFNVMRRLGVDGEVVRREIEKFVGMGPEHEVATKIPFTPRARKALQLAADEARALNQPRINAEHIFLGLVLEGSGVAAAVLKNLGVQLEKAREEILREMRDNPGAA